MKRPFALSVNTLERKKLSYNFGSYLIINGTLLKKRSFALISEWKREQVWKSIEANSLIRVETCGKVVESWGLMVKLFPQ